MVAHVQIPTATIATKTTETQIHWIRGPGSPTDTGNTKTSLLSFAFISTDTRHGPTTSNATSISKYARERSLYVCSGPKPYGTIWTGRRDKQLDITISEQRILIGVHNLHREMGLRDNRPTGRYSHYQPIRACAPGYISRMKPRLLPLRHWGPTPSGPTFLPPSPESTPPGQATGTPPFLFVPIYTEWLKYISESNLEFNIIIIKCRQLSTKRSH